MFYLPLSLSFLFSYSSTILSFSFLKFFIPSFAILLCSFPFHHLVYSIYFSIHKKIDLISTLHRPYTQLFFFVTQLREKWKKKPPHFYCFSITTTFLLFSLHHHHISTVSLQHHHHHHSSIVSLLHHHHHHHHHISIVFTPPVVLLFEFGLFGLRLACLACGWPLTL